MDYEKNQTFNGDPAKALDFAARLFASNGFRIENKSATSLEVISNGGLRNVRTGIQGVSRALVAVTGNQISVRAEFGTARRVVRGVACMLVGMAVLFLVVFQIFRIGPNSHGRSFPTKSLPEWAIILISVAPLSPWPVLLPVIAAKTRRRMMQELDTLLHNMTMIAD